ncbi:MAG TPA: glycosyltransferase family 39 protein [Sedimentisphaerales bacterium]|nr:glycosyltransferase family 39 protein [Sedimentisphaerales bacterium]
MGRGEQFKFDVLRLAFLMGLCSVIGVYLILTTTLITKDGAFYIEQAKQIAQDPSGVCRRYPPGYPFLIWAGHAVASRFAEGDSPLLWAYSAQAVTLLCRVLTLIPLYLLGRLLVGSVNSFWALFVLVILPYPAFYGSDVLREWPYLLFLSTGLLVLYRGLATERWRTLAPVGLVAGLGSLVRPECAQLILYAMLGVIVVGRSASVGDRLHRRPVPLGAILPAIVGFVLPIVPYVRAGGGLVPHQLRPASGNMPPVVSAIGPEAASNAPVRFETRAGELLELPIQAADPDGDPLTFSLAGSPVGSRPVYEFRSNAASPLWTLVEDEKDRLIELHRKAWQYQGIAWYAYARADARAGLLPVYRFWSRTHGGHLFTTSESQKQALLAEWSPERWVYEGVSFYAFGQDNPPANTIAVHRLSDPTQGHSWPTTPPAQDDAPTGFVAWYAHPAQDPPTGARIEAGVFRWRPAPDQAGEHQINLIVTDGELSCCQLILVRVLDASPAGRNLPGSRAAALAGVSGFNRGALRSVVCRVPLGRLAAATDELADGLLDNFMIVPVLPWVLGLWVHLKSRANRLERTLVLAVLVVGAGLVIGRSVWFPAGSARRYSLPLIALTIFYLPTGVDVMVRVLNRVYTFGGRLAGFGVARRSLWFYLLLLGGGVLCAPKLVSTPLRADKSGYRSAARWLRENTPAHAVIADPDRRIAFYAGRDMILCERYPDWRRADFVVAIAGQTVVRAPKGWERVYSVAVGPQEAGELAVYARPPASE